MNTLQLQAVMIDLDGTMVDTLGDFEVALNRALDRSEGADGQPRPDRAQHRQRLGMIRTVLGHQLGQPGMPVDAREVEALFTPVWTRYEHHYLAINGEFSQVFAGVMEGLELLKATGLPLACLTNKPLSFTRPLLAQKGLTPYFAHVFGGDSFERKKPDPLPLLKTCGSPAEQPRPHTHGWATPATTHKPPTPQVALVVLMTYGYNHGEPIRNTPARGVVGLHDATARLGSGVMGSCPA